MKYFTEIKPYTAEELAKLRVDYTFAVRYLGCEVTFEVYCGLVYLDQLNAE